MGHQKGPPPIYTDSHVAFMACLQVFSIVAAILMMGNVEFSEAPGLPFELCCGRERVFEDSGSCGLMLTVTKTCVDGSWVRV